MRCAVYTDNTLPLAVDPLVDVLNQACRSITFHAGTNRLRIDDSQISYPSSYDNLPADLLSEAANFDFAFLCTNVPYDNNFFFHYDGTIALVSFYGWNLLTDIPITNGIAYFIASIVCDQRDIGESHQENTGCINDFWWDKRGVDLGMRAAFICGKCLKEYTGDPKVLEDIQALLDLVCSASRQGKDLLNVKPRASITEEHFDVFLCHNSADKSAIRRVNASLKEAAVLTWLDEEQLKPGLPWQPKLEQQISLVRAACVFVGENGVGPWQDMEVRAFLSEFVGRGCPVIPVILPSAPEVPQLPLFLKQMTWVDLRRHYEKNLRRLIGALKRA